MTKTTTVGAVHAVILAAGSSTRMGATNKLLLPASGVPMVRRAAATVAASSVVSCRVVLGFEHQRVALALRGLPAVQTVINHRHWHGQASSILLGLNDLVRGNPGSRPLLATDAVMVCLSDQPLLETQHLLALQRAFFQQDKPPLRRVLVPTVSGSRGNPVIFSGAVAQTLVANQWVPRTFMRRYPQLVSFYPLSHPAWVRDVDTPGDWNALPLTRRAVV